MKPWLRTIGIGKVLFEIRLILGLWHVRYGAQFLFLQADLPRSSRTLLGVERTSISTKL